MKSKVLAPDRIAPIHLHHLGPIELRYLTDTINLSAKSAEIPIIIWKGDRVISLLMPGKLIDEFKLFRPIAVLSPLQN